MPIGDTARLIASLELEDKFSGPARNAEGAMGRLEGRTGALGGRFAQVTAGLGQMGRGIGQVGAGIDRIATRVAVAGAAGLGAIITTAASFEQSEAGIRKTVAGTTEEVDNLIASIKDMSRTVPLSFEELAAIAAEGGALGIATTSLANFTNIVARLGVSTDLTTDQAATALGQMQNVLQLTDQDLQDFADSLVALGNDGASTESQILDLATRFGAAGHQAGLSHEAILALASATASMGVEAEAGGGALSRIFNGITLDIATATDEGQLMAESMGLSLAELRTAWDQDAGAVFGDLLGVIKELDQFEAAEFLSNLGITNVRDINAITLLAEGVEEYNRQLGVSVGQTDELNRESQAFFNTTEGKWEIFKNNVRLAADTVGGELLPVVNEVLGDLVAKLSEPGTQQTLKEFGENLAGGIRSFVGEIRNADFGPLLDTLRTAGSIAKGAFDAFRSLPSEVQALALAAFGINKLTGGALTSIAGGLGNIIGGGIKILFERGASPANPLWVQQVGGIGGAGGPGGTGGGGFGGFLAGAVAIGAGVAAGLAIGVPIFRAAVDPAKEFEQGQVDRILETGDPGRIREAVAILDDELAFWREKPPQVRAAMEGVIAEFQAQRDALATALPVLGPPLGFHPKFELRPGFSEARNVGDRAPVLPDTAMLPLIGALDRFTQSVERSEKGEQPSSGGPFVETVKLDPSQVVDLRKETATAAKEVRTLALDARAADQANRTNTFLLVHEQQQQRLATVERLNALAAKYDAQNAELRGANSKLGIIAAKNATHPVTVNNSITIPVSLSATLLEQRIVTARQASIGIPTAPTIL